MTRSVFRPYLVNCGNRLASVRNQRSRSSPVASLAMTPSIVPLPTSIMTFGKALRL
jgi:hypothetical protein